MKSFPWTAALLCAATALVSDSLVSAQRLPNEPLRQFGSSITGAFEGWFDSQDGSHNFLVGYLNRNAKQPVDVPIGPNNRIEPGGPDMGQPTHFLPGRKVGMFLVTAPKEFTPQQKLTWTLVVNGEVTQIPLRLNIDYNVSPFGEGAGVGNTPPVVRLEEKGATFQGPVGMLSKAVPRTTPLASPLTLAVWTSDDAKYTSGTNAPMRNAPPPVRLHWTKFRGPGDVTFEKADPAVEVLEGGKVGAPFSGKSSTTAKFSQAGEYIVHLTANDFSGDGGGGEVCCWTTVMLKVTVTP